MTPLTTVRWLRTLMCWLCLAAAPLPVVAEDDRATFEQEVQSAIDEVANGLGTQQMGFWHLHMKAPRSIPYVVGAMGDPRPIPLDGIERTIFVSTKSGLSTQIRADTVGEALCYLMYFLSDYEVRTSDCLYLRKEFEGKKSYPSPINEWRAWCVEKYPDSKDICLGAKPLPR